MAGAPICNSGGARATRPVSYTHLYHEIFTLPDNASIVVTHFDGSTVTRPCQYIDEAHAKIGSSVFHMLEFAGLMERTGSIYAPEGGVEMCIRDSPKSEWL